MKSPSWTIFWGIVSATVGKHTLPDLYNLTLSRPGFFPQRLGFWFLQPTSSVAAFRQNAGRSYSANFGTRTLASCGYVGLDR